MFCPDINKDCKGESCRDWDFNRDQCIKITLNDYEIISIENEVKNIDMLNSCKNALNRKESTQ